MRRLIVATTNAHKLEEMRVLLEDLNMEVLGLTDIDFNDEVEENGKTFSENAIIKAKTISYKCNDLVMADDSGIEIDAFNKEPGIYSARYLGHDTPYAMKNKQILIRMENETNRSARLVCSIALCLKGSVLFEASDSFEGEIATEILGENGFGYDPIFYYPPMNLGAAQMSMDEKNLVSHRGKAIRKLITFIKENVD